MFTVFIMKSEDVFSQVGLIESKMECLSEAISVG